MLAAERAGAGASPSWAEVEAFEEGLGDLVEVRDGAMLALLAAPAPDLGALALKLGLIGRHAVWEMSGGEDCLAWVQADAERLSVESSTFNRGRSGSRG